MKNSFVMKKTFQKFFLPGILLLSLLVIFNCRKLDKMMLVSTVEVTVVNAVSAEVTGEVIDLGDGADQHGHCFGKAPNVTISGTKTQLGVPAGTGGFTSTLEGLEPGTKYYFKAYLSNGTETVYGKELSFTTNSGATGIPTLSTTTVSSWTTTTAISGGTITSNGGAAITAKGVCWSTAANPVTTDPKTSDGSGSETFISNISGLNPSTTYHVRAYAVNSEGTGYGNDVTFTTSSLTPVIPTLSTTAVTIFTSTTAVSGGNITDTGGAGITAKGVCWSKVPNPTTTDPKTNEGPGSGSFISNIAGLDPLTTYHVRAYAINSAGTAYGNGVSFTTSAAAPVIPTLSTTAVTGITATTALSGGFISATGGADIISRGVCWSTSLNPTIEDPKTTDGSGPGSFTSSITGLSPSGTYHVRAYATNSAGTGYGNDISFPTSAVPAPNAPSELSALPGSSSQIRINWTDNSNNEEGFKIERSPDGITGWAEIFTTNPDVTTYHDEGLESSKEYHYRVRAFNSNGVSGYSNTAMAQTKSVPAILHIVNNTHYDMIDITLNGTQKIITTGSGILVGNSFDVEFNEPGNVTFMLGVGFWNGAERNVWFVLNGDITVESGNITNLVFENPTIGQLLSGFKRERDWAGIYYDAYLNAHIAGYTFTSTGEWTFYDDFIATASGTVTLVSWVNYATAIVFKTCATCGNISLEFPFSSFSYSNGPPSWPTIEYIAQ